MTVQNILMNNPPDAVSVNGVLFDLYTDYRVWLKAGKLLEEFSTADDAGKNALFFDLCGLVIRDYPEKGYVVGDELLQGLLEFYRGYPLVENRRKAAKARKQSQTPVFDFVYDADYIYCSFASFYQIRLQTLEYMHWWEFLTLFRGLMMSDQTSVNFVVGARQQKTTPKMPKEEKERIQRLKEEFALPEDEKTREAAENLAGALVKMGRKGKKEKQE